jgi:hypothetical protein
MHSFSHAELRKLGVMIENVGGWFKKCLSVLFLGCARQFVMNPLPPKLPLGEESEALPKERGRPARQLRGFKVSREHAGESPALRPPPGFLQWSQSVSSLHQPLLYQMMFRMQKLRLLLALVLALAWFTTTAQAQTAATTSTGNADPNPAAQKVCDAISTITGVAISPLMGVSGVGAWKYFHAKTAEERAALPWFALPIFWVPAMLIVGLCFAKDSAGLVVPPGLKKPFDVLETAEHKISGLVATGAFVPLVASVFKVVDDTAPAAHSSALHLGSLGFASISVTALLGNAIMVPVAMVAFFIVFLASNAINIIILLSPFGQIDAALKLARTAIIGTVIGSSAFGSWSGHPWIGALWAIIVILFSYLIAGWSFRLSHFGVVFLWDYFTGRKSRFKPDPKENKLFLARKINKVPARTYGKLSLNEKGELVLHYRPWLVLAPRTLVLPPGKYETGRGVFYSEILHIENDTARTLILLPPRYLGHEEEITKLYHFADTRDVGLRAVWTWFKSLFSGQPAAA